jgi:hypothetical protein
MANPPARRESVACVLPTHIRSCETDVKIKTARKSPKYRTATPVVVARMMYPTAPITPNRATNGPRIRVRSDTHAVPTISIQHRKYGGALSPLDWIAEKAPISEMMVGTKRGSDAKHTLQPK